MKKLRNRGILPADGDDMHADNTLTPCALCGSQTNHTGSQVLPVCEYCKSRLLQHKMSTFEALRYENQDMLVKFLKLDVELAGTFIDIAANKGNKDRREEVLGKVQRAIDSLRKFVEKVDNDWTKRDLSDQIDDLQRGLETAS